MKRAFIFICFLLDVFLIPRGISRAECKSSDEPAAVSDTISNHVVMRYGSYATVSKIGIVTNKELFTESFDYNESGNKNAIVQCSIKYSKEKMSEIIEGALIEKGDKCRKVGRLAVSIILSRTLNVEYFEIRGQGLDALTSKEILNIYQAINFSQLFVQWKEPVPYVIFGVQVVI